MSLDTTTAAEALLPDPSAGGELDASVAVRDGHRRTRTATTGDTGGPVLKLFR